MYAHAVSVRLTAFSNCFCFPFSGSASSTDGPSYSMTLVYSKRLTRPGQARVQSRWQGQKRRVQNRSVVQIPVTLPPGTTV